MYFLVKVVICVELKGTVMVFNATFNNISVISWRQFYWWWKPLYPGKNTVLSQFT